MIRVGIVGVRRGSSFFALNHFDGVRVTAICDLQPEALIAAGEAHGIAADMRFADYAAMLDHVDAVVVGTPIEHHAAQSIAALEAGKHVLCEVTAAETSDQCRALVAAAERSAGVYMMAENYCYRRPVVLVREMARQGLFGELYYGEGEYVHNCRALRYHPDGSLTWRGEWRLRHTGVSYPTHSVGPLARIFDDRPVSVACGGSGSVCNPEFKHDDCNLALVRTARGGLWKIRVDNHSLRPHNMAFYQVQGTLGCWESSRGLGDQDVVWLKDRSSDPNRWEPLSALESEFLPAGYLHPPEEALRAGHGGGDWWELADFVAAVRGERPPAVDVHDAVRWTLVGIVSEQSLACGGSALPIEDPAEWRGAAQSAA
ncbi:MAG: Gfo/Idh/MocA family oxidoreductase [Armatimonadetes bacterium]|nr:Gfo/Idh/MocA family oxidoreductase [Armatimonadota bacterium]